MAAWGRGRATVRLYEAVEAGVITNYSTTVCAVLWYAVAVGLT